MDKTSIFNIKTGHFVQKHQKSPKKFLEKKKVLNIFKKEICNFFENPISEKSLKLKNLFYTFVKLIIVNNQV